jgi:AcrR family transcriptional regulator
MANPQDSPLVKAPLQDRSRKTLERVLAAGWSLLEEGGPDALTVQLITKRARTSVGSFYARFQGKDDLLRYMGEDALDRAATRWEEVRSSLAEIGADAESEGGLRDILEPAVQGLGELYLSGPGRDLAFMEGIQDAAPTRRRRLEDRVASELAALLPGGDALRAELGVRVLAGTLHDAAVRARTLGSTGASPYPEEGLLLSELVELLTGYLGGRVRPPIAAAMKSEPEPVEEDVSAKTSGINFPAESSPEPDAPPSPDPFEVWG